MGEQENIIAEIKSALRGCLEIPVFLKQGVDRFSGTPRAILHSFIVLLIMIAVFYAVYPPEEKYADKPENWELTQNYVSSIFSTLLYLSIFFLFRPKNSTLDQFGKFISGYNWLSVSVFVIYLPFIVMGHAGIYAWDEVYNITAVFLIYLLAFQAFFTKHVLNATWPYAILFSVLDIIIGQAGDGIIEKMLIAIWQ